MDLKVPGESRESEDDGSEQVVERGGDTLDIVITHVYHTMHNAPSIAYNCQQFTSIQTNKAVMI